MLREIYLDRFNKIVTAFKPDLFASLTILKSKPYNRYVEQYQVQNEEQETYNLYISDQPLEPVLQQLPFIEASPKILLFNTEREHIILEQRTQETLYEHLCKGQQIYAQQPEPRQPLAKRVLLGIKKSLMNYMQNNVNYNAISPKNIVMKNNEWQLSLTGLLLKNDKESQDYYKNNISGDKNAYTLGTLLFKILFGFVPFERTKDYKKFSFKQYPNFLDKEQNKKFLKVYLYADGLLDISSQTKSLIQESLAGSMNLQQFYNHKFFDPNRLCPSRKQLSPVTRQIKMLSLFEQSHQSLILAAIQHRKKHPHQKINAKLIYAHDFTSEETIQHLKKHPLLYEIRFDRKFQSDKDKGQVVEEQESIPVLNITYFYREDDFDPQLDLPCRDLMKLIESYLSKNDYDDERAKQFEQRLKLYAYPYTVAFELAKVSKSQSVEIQRKIRRLTEDLLQVSQLHYFSKVDRLHQTELVVKDFDDIKIRFRQQLNDLYKHFLNQAIRKYNVKKEFVPSSQRVLSKTQGLQYYKLCLKLMECSVLNRKKGKDLDLQRIQTSTRKQIESDLNQLLKQFFPTKIQRF